MTTQTEQPWTPRPLKLTNDADGEFLDFMIDELQDVQECLVAEGDAAASTGVTVRQFATAFVDNCPRKLTRELKDLAFRVAPSGRYLYPHGPRWRVGRLRDDVARAGTECLKSLEQLATAIRAALASPDPRVQAAGVEGLSRMAANVAELVDAAAETGKESS